MGRIRHTPEQIAAVLRQSEAGAPVVEIVRKLGVQGMNKTQLGYCANAME